METNFQKSSINVNAVSEIPELTKIYNRLHDALEFNANLVDRVQSAASKFCPIIEGDLAKSAKDKPAIGGAISAFHDKLEVFEIQNRYLMRVAEHLERIV